MRFLISVTLRRCAREEVAPQRLSLEVLGDAGQGWKCGTGVEPTNYEAQALRSITTLWDTVAAKARGRPMRFSVTASRLTQWPSRQFELFEREGTEVQRVLDTVRSRFGARALTLGASTDRARYTGLKIAFQHIPDIEDFYWLDVEVPEVHPPEVHPPKASVN